MPACFEPRPYPLDECGHVGDGARDGIVEPAVYLFDARVQHLDVADSRTFGYAAYDRRLLGYRVHGREPRLGEEYGQRYARETAAAADIDDARPRIETADAGNGQRMEYVAYVELVEVLARNDVDFRVPVGVQGSEGFELLLLPLGQVGEVFQNAVGHRVSVFLLRLSAGTCVRVRGVSVSLRCPLAGAVSRRSPRMNIRR